jgi:hypothetical protein
MPLNEIPSGIPMLFASHLLDRLASRRRDGPRIAAKFPMEHIMKVQFRNTARSEFSALMTVVAILMTGMLTKLGIAIDVFHHEFSFLSH